MGSFKIIIFIIIIVIGITKTIMSDAKQDKAKKRKPRPVPRPAQTPLSPPEPVEERSNPSPNFLNSPYAQEEEAVESASPVFEKPIETQVAIDEEQRNAQLDRWRRALIDSEILKRKF